MKKYIVLIVMILMLAACGGVNEAPLAVSDSGQNFNTQDEDGSRIPVDDTVYLVTGRVIGGVDSLVRKTGGDYWSSRTTTYEGYSSTSVYYTPAVVDGKGFVRLHVHDVTPETEMAPVDEIVILKTSDTKVRSLIEGDVVTMKCRAQYENVAAVRDREVFDAEKLETWELDYCRMVLPVVDVDLGR